MLSGIKFVRNSQNKVVGFTIITDSIKNLLFEKVIINI